MPTLLVDGFGDVPIALMSHMGGKLSGMRCMWLLYSDRFIFVGCC